MLSSVARRFQIAAEPFFSVSFYAPEMNEEFEAIGLDGFRGYFLGRSAGMGRASAAAVAAAFYNFAPNVIEQFVRWDGTDPQTVADARARGASRALQRLLEDVDVSGMGKALQLLREAVDATRGDGRILYQTTRALPWPDDEIAAAWFGVTLLREYRGDGHNVVLIEHGLSGPEALLLHAGYVGWEDKARDWLLVTRSWPEDVYASAAASLRERGFAQEDGSLTDAGLKFREMLEMETDRLSTPPFEALGAERSEELIGLIGPWSEVIVARKGIPRRSARLTRDPGQRL